MMSDDVWTILKFNLQAGDILQVEDGHMYANGLYFQGGHDYVEIPEESLVSLDTVLALLDGDDEALAVALTEESGRLRTLAEAILNRDHRRKSE